MSSGKATVLGTAKTLAVLSFLQNKSEMGNLIRAFDWASTSLGPMSEWPQSLRTTVNIILESPVPIVMLWGKDGIMLYNDAYSVFAGGRHPTLLGSKVLEGWPEVAEFNRNVMKQGFKGKSLSYKDQQLTLYRNNRPEEVWMNLNYSPIMDETGKPAGVMAIVVETTERVQAEQKQADAERALLTEQKRLYDLFMHAPVVVAVLQGPQHVYELANPLYLQVVGNRPILGKPIRQALPELEGQGIYEILDGVYSSGEPSYGNEVPIKLDTSSSEKGAITQCYFNFVYQPYFSNEGTVEGILVHAVDVTDQVIARKEVEEQNHVLEMIAGGASLKDTLDFLLLSIEKQSANGMIGSILILDETQEHLRHGGAPSLPASYNKAIDGITIGPNVGSCGTAAYTKKPVIANDTQTDPRWKDFKTLANEHNLRSCWSTPILSADDQVLGTFAMYYRQPHEPTDDDQHIVKFVTRTAALIIERKKAEEALLASEERFRFMAETLPLKIFTADAKGDITAGTLCTRCTGLYSS
jgi:PAS domain S-box-containing protein